MGRISGSLLVVLFSACALLAQDPGRDREAEKLKAERRAKVIEAIMRDAAQLKLPENRALVSAKLGAVIWKDDTERGIALFRVAIGGLIAAQGAAEANKNPNQQYYDLINSQSLRPLILNSIASVDAELALEGFYRSRPAAIQKALASATSRGKISYSSANYAYLAQQEINLEQRLIRMISEQKPERAIAILKENIKKHLSGETLAMLKKVWEKEPGTGNELANEVVDRLISKAFFEGTNNQVNYELVNLSNSILSEYVRERSPEEKYIAFDESRMRSLAGKVISAYVERGGAMGYIPLQQLEPIAKRFSPGSYEQLKKVAENSSNFGRHGLQADDAEYTKLMNSNPTAETLISEAKKFPLEKRSAIYCGAANKLTEAGQYERAVALLNDNFDDDALENAISSLNWYYAQHLVNRGEFDAAESMMMEFNESNRISALSSLATTIYSRNPEENRSRANGILQRVRSLLPERPDTNNELSQLLQLISTMANIEPAEAFRNFEPAVGQINEVTEAWAVVNGFQGGGNLRQGEYLMSGGFNFGVYVDPSIFRTLAQKDFVRTMALVDGFSRREMRILTLIGLLESGI